jgi:hypothetical protein
MVVRVELLARRVELDDLRAAERRLQRLERQFGAGLQRLERDVGSGGRSPARRRT